MGGKQLAGRNDGLNKMPNEQVRCDAAQIKCRFQLLSSPIGNSQLGQANSSVPIGIHDRQCPGLQRWIRSQGGLIWFPEIQQLLLYGLKD